MFHEAEEFHLSPIDFLALSADCFYQPLQSPEFLSARHQLAPTSALSGEELFAQIAVGWNEEGLAFQVAIAKRFEKAFYPDVHRGDSVELFIDTRDMKRAGFNTRFCHHFFFFGEPVEDKLCGEITRFRTEDIHEWCNPKDLQLTTHLKQHRYELQIFIPGSCLHGYAPDQFDRLGFSYRINRFLGEPQHFSLVSSEYQIDQQPSLWSSLRLLR